MLDKGNYYLSNIYIFIFHPTLPNDFEFKFNEIIGSWVESELAGFFVFSHVRMMGYFSLG